jgi:hypothetical protein
MSESSAVTPGAKSSSEIPQTMKAVICHGPEDYRLEEVAVPHPGPSFRSPTSRPDWILWAAAPSL